MKNYLTALFLICNVLVFAQSDLTPKVQSAQERNDQSLKNTIVERSILRNMESENIGPTIMSGRITDLAVNPNDPTHFYVAYASGGLWVTHNNGTTFSPIFDHESVMTIGAIAVNWDKDIIWVGTGEVNSSRSSYAGNGVYKSNDQGESWDYLGLPESHHIGRIILHPTNENTAWVAVLGHLYSDNEERGVYMTTDQGSTWTQTLYIDNKTGVVDMVMDPQNNNHLYAAAWQRERRAWNFEEAGAGSGIHESTDGGVTWTMVSGGTSGFPQNEGVGRIGLAMYNDGEKTKLYAFLDNYNRRPKEEDNKEEKGHRKDDFKSMTTEKFASLSDDQLDQFLRDTRFPKKYTAATVKADVAEGKIKPIALAEYLEDANSLLFDTPVVGAEVYVSEDFGATWSKTHDGYFDGLIYSYGYYFGQIRVAPYDQNIVYIMGVPILKSEDGGKSFKSINGENVHVDHHALWINEKREGHLINGNDGGINISYDDGENWIKCNSPSVGQFYYINADMAEPYNVYGGLQDNGVWVGSHQYRDGVRWHQKGKYPYQEIMGGDGMQIQIDNRDNNTVYTGYQFGNYFRMNRNGSDRTYITPKHELGERPYRWNWQSPILISPHNQDIIYLGCNQLMRSFDQGNNFQAISEDLTNGGKKGDVPYGTLTSIDESVFTFGLIYTGSDDGLVYRTRDAGNTWEKISDELPQQMWVSRVQASKHKEGRVYASLNGYRWDDFNAYVYRSDDYGDTWTDISMALPNEPINVIKEDPNNENIIYVGSDHGTYVSFDRGANYMSISDDIPNVAVHDLVVHPREPHLLVGTHGRSIYKLNVDHLRSIAAMPDTELVLFEDVKLKYRANAGKIRNIYSEPVEFSAVVDYYSSTSQSAKLMIQSPKGKIFKELDVDLDQGIGALTINMDVESSKVKDILKYVNKDKEKDEKLSIQLADDGKYYLPVGSYDVVLKASGKKAAKKFTIED